VGIQCELRQRSERPGVLQLPAEVFQIDLPGGTFSTDLVPLTISYEFTTLASLQALIQYNSQTFTVSSNIRLALLDRSGTGFFFVYNDQRDVTSVTPDTILGRSFIVKYTRLFDF